MFLLDSGATGNFVSSSFLARFNLASSPLPHSDLVTLADGSQQSASGIVLGASLVIGSYTDSLDLVALALSGYDAILGMPWLERVNPEINWRQRTVSLVDQQSNRHVLESPSSSSLVVVSSSSSSSSQSSSSSSSQSS